MSIIKVLRQYSYFVTRSGKRCMMSDDEFLKFNNGKSFSFKSLNSDININDVADEKLKKLLKSNVFDINGNGIIEAGTQEAQNLWNAIKTAASRNSSSRF